MMMDGWWHIGALSLIGIIWIIIQVALIVAIIWGIVYFIRWLIARGDGRSLYGRDEAMEILRQRFARGEITEQEFETMKEKLKR